MPLLRRLIRICTALLLLGGSFSLVSANEQATVSVENRSSKLIKIAIPGAKPLRIKPNSGSHEVTIDITKRNGVDAKAWWVSKPRELCIIFVRYQGHIIVSGKDEIRCLGN